MTCLLFLTQKTTLQKAVYLLRNISTEYNLENPAKKTKVFGFVETDHLRTKIIINDETPEQVSQFTYLGCNISYQFSNDVEFKLAKFLQLICTINPSAWSDGHCPHAARSHSFVYISTS